MLPLALQRISSHFLPSILAASASAAGMESGRESRLDEPTPTVSHGGNADRTPGSGPMRE